MSKTRQQADLQATFDDMFKRMEDLTRAINTTNQTVTTLSSNQATFRQSITQTLNDTQNRVTLMQKDVQVMATRVEEYEKRVEDNEKMTAENKTNITEIKSSIAQEKEATMKELFEIEAKRPNLVVFGVPEPDRTLQPSSHYQDVKKMDEIFTAMAGEKRVFQLQRRIGKPGEKPRPILIRMPNTVDKELILSKGKVLKDHPQWKNVVVKPDMTANQRDFAKKRGDDLAAVAVAKNADLKNGETFKWVVRGRGVRPHLGKATVAQA